MAVFNVTDYGAMGLGAVDEYAALKAAVLACEAAGGGVVYLPAGTYLLGLHDQYSGLNLTNLNPLTIVGDGNATVLRALGGDYTGRGDFYLLRAQGDNFTLQDICLDGNRANLLNAEEQTHLLQIQNVRHASIRNVTFENARSDGIRLLGTGEVDFNDDVSIEGCTFEGNGRSGITCQRAFRHTRIIGNHFRNTNDQDIDFEPTGGSAPKRVIIVGNTMVRSVPGISVTLSGVSGVDRLRDVVFSNNVISGGSVFGTDLEGVVIANNVIRSSGVESALTLSRAVEDVVVSSNVLSSETAHGLSLFAANGRQPSGVVVRGNSIRVAVAYGVAVESARDCSIQGNTIRATAGNGVTGIHLRGVTTALDMSNLSVLDNHIHGFRYGVNVAAGPASVRNASVRGNSISNLPEATGKVGILQSQTATAPLWDVDVRDNMFGAGITVRYQGP